MIDTTEAPQRGSTPDARWRNDRRMPLLTRSSLLIAALCGFVAVFGIAHLLLVRITRPSGYIFFGTLATAAPLIAATVYGLARDRRAILARFAFGALMCACAVPVIYLARFAPESARPTVRNLLGLPFLILALVGPGIFSRFRGHKAGA